MNIIQETQIASILEESIKTAQESAVTLNMASLRSIMDSLVTNDDVGRPLFTGIKIERMQPIDYLNDHNINIKSLNMDYKALTAGANWLYEEVNRINDYSIMMNSFFEVIESRIKSQHLDLRKKLELGNKAITIDFKDKSLIAQATTATVDDKEGKVTLRKLTEGSRIFKFKDPGKVSIKAEFGSGSALHIEKMISFLDPAYNGETFFSVITRDPTMAKGRLSFRLDEQDESPWLNNITIRSRNSVPTKVKPIIVSNGVEIPLSEVVLTNQNMTVAFDGVRVDGIILELEQTIYNDIVKGTYEFIFMFSSLLLENTVTTGSDTLLTESLDAGDFITSVSIRTDDKLPPDTSIDYYVSPDNQSWSRIIPMNYGQDSFNIVSIGGKLDQQIDDIGTAVTSWQELTPENNYGNSTLYNLLENADSAFIINDQIDVSGGVEHVDVDSILLYRGMDNYAIETRTIETEVYNENSLYMFYMKDGRLNAYSIYVNINREPTVVRSNTRIKVKYRPTNTKFVRVFDINGNEIEVLQQIGRELVLRSITPGSTVYVNYTAEIVDIEEADGLTITIDEDSFEVRTTPGGADLGRRGIIYDRSNKLITLSQNNPYNKDIGQKGNYQLYISFKYVISTTNEVRLYKTYVKYESQVELKIYPFTQEEIKAGNIHMIDSVLVSSMDKYTISRGWHEINTTQPYKTDPDNPLDVNRLTNKQCAAGINLGEYSEMRAFKDPMKLVSVKNLANRVRKGDHRSFAFDNNKILLNFIPEELPSLFETNATHLEGSDLIDKRAVYDNDAFSYYERVDDAFQVKYTIIDESRTGQLIWVKAVLNREPTATESPEIRRIELTLI